MTSKLHKSTSNVDTDRREQIAALTCSEEIDNKVVGVQKMEDTAVILTHLLPSHLEWHADIQGTGNVYPQHFIEKYSHPFFFLAPYPTYLHVTVAQNAPPASSVNFEACESSSTNKRLKKEKIARTQVEHPNMQLKLHSQRLKKGKMFQQEVLYLRTSRGAQFLQKTKQLTSDVIWKLCNALQQ